MREGERIEDSGLIRSGIKEKLKNHARLEGLDIDDLVSKAFVEGLSHYIVSEGSIERVDPENLVDDEFSYKRWQLNLYESVSKQYPGIEWAEVKSAFLKKGLEQMD